MTTTNFTGSIEPLNITIWEKVNLNLFAKTLTELMHEHVALPLITGKDEDGLIHFRLNTDHENIYYTFSGYPRMLDYWHVLKPSIKKHENGKERPATDVSAFFVEVQETFGLNSFTLAHYIEEILHTLYADAFMLSKGRIAVGTLADADYQTIEHQMEGHPWIIVNKGRLDFNHTDYLNYAPEANKNIKLLWIAVHKSRAAFKAVEEINEKDFFEAELGKETVAAFKNVLSAKNADPADYLFLPVHEWQWNNKLLILFASDIANQLLIPLASGDDIYSPQQSIRTFFNLSHPDKHYVKTAISILNTGTVRGLPPKQLAIAPRLTAWLKHILLGDQYLQDLGLILLGEVATIGYLHPDYTEIKDPPFQYNEYLGALWRESPGKFLKPGERLMTMAALLYVDDSGKSLVAELIEKSGLKAGEWLMSYLNAYLRPILHIYYQHAVCVNPHGENVILVMENYVPVRIVLKDFAGDILLNEEAQAKLPKDFSENMILSSNPESVPLVILIGVFEAYFRYLGDIFETTTGYDEKSFWRSVYNVIQTYQDEHPELNAKFERYNLFVPHFKRLNINSQRLFNGYKETTGFARSFKSGELGNPLTQFRTEETVSLKES
ncbi:IucA/IucC family protein [Pedobacter lusitanus]|uniref:IucA/IucC family protein n=1 Tax=Pedobacter lusitanus TaxID=1503925 RepID=A0A0D0GVG9_9SPHI|nr:IucA/IucC family siderophore biosynthesis protein [Pedobacter lusitanus]KIO78391.1 IucA/IucC family protein [Pedobacter lusitanus]